MVITFAGRLPGDAFPSANVAHVRRQIELIVAGLRPRVVVGSAAAGADLLVAQAAARQGCEVKLVLAGSVQEFRASSVAGRGTDWEALFDAICADSKVGIEERPRGSDDDAAYADVTSRIIAQADELSDDEPVVALIVAARATGAHHSSDLAGRQDVAGRLVLHVDPSRTAAQAPSAFIAMPYGKRGPARTYDADATYKRIMLPAIIDSGFQPIRADTEALLEVIDITMLRVIGAAEVLIADLATLNPNVMWEVGVRHAWRRSGTILLRPAGTDTPFDVSHARVHEYRREESGVSDDDAITGILQLRGLLVAAAENRTDSPVFATVSSLQEQRLHLQPGDNEVRLGERLLEDISAARDLREPDKLLALAGDVRGTEALDPATRLPLLEQIGLALISAGRHADAVEILGPIAENDTALSRVRLHQQYAHALIRSDAPGDRDARLAHAEQRLRALRARHAPSAETTALLASVAKSRVEVALAAGAATEPFLDLAIGLYLEGFADDPRDYYPGIVAIALLRLRGQHLSPNADDLQRAATLIPVVRFVTTRRGDPVSDDVWAWATLAELALHQHLMADDRAALPQACRIFRQVALTADRQQRDSISRQLRLMLNAGDPRAVLEPVLAMFGDT